MAFGFGNGSPTPLNLDLTKTGQTEIRQSRNPTTLVDTAFMPNRRLSKRTAICQFQCSWRFAIKEGPENFRVGQRARVQETLMLL
jgi:hypothetical protein